MNSLLDPWRWHPEVVPKRRSTFRNIQEEGRSILHRGGSLKLRKFGSFYLTTLLINERQCHIRGRLWIVNKLRRGWKLPWPKLRWSKSLKLGNDIGIAGEPVKSFEPSTSRQPWTNSTGDIYNRRPTEARCTVLAFLCVNVNDEHRDAMYSRTSCDCSQLTGLQRNQNSPWNVTAQHTCT